jgi:hypothetical protein
MRTAISMCLGYEIQAKRVCLVQSRHHYHIIEVLLALAMKLLKNCTLGVKQQSLTHNFHFDFCISICVARTDGKVFHLEPALGIFSSLIMGIFI